MKKKFLALVLTLAMVLSLVPVTALATGATQEGNNQGPVEVTGSDNDKKLTMKKTVTPVQNQDGTYQDGTYTVRLESYAKGEVTPTTTTKQMDIVLLLDVSGSMDQAFTPASSEYRAVYDGSLDTGKQYYIQRYGWYYEVSYCNICNKWTRGCYDWFGHVKGREFVPKTAENDNDDTHTQFYEYVYTNEQSKLDALKTAVNQFIEGIAENSPQSNISIVKFAGETTESIGNETYGTGNNKENYTQIVKKLTKVGDGGANRLKQAVSQLTAAGATSSDYGLQKAQKALENATKDKVVVLFTDGEPNHFNGFDYKVATTAVNTAKTLKQNNTTIYTVGVFKNPDNDINLYMSSVSSNYPEATATAANNGRNWTVTNGDSDNGKHYINAENAADLINAFKTISSQVSSTHLNGNAVVVDKVPSNFKAPANDGDVTLKVANYKVDGTFDTAMDAPDEIHASVNGNGTVSVTGFDFSKNWCGLEGDTPHGQKLIIEFTIERTNYGGTQPTNAGAYIKAKADDEKEIIKLTDPTVPVTVQLPGVNNPDVKTKTYDGTGFDIKDEIGKIIAGLVPVDGTKNKFIDLTYKIKDNEGNTVGTYTISAGQTTGTWSTDSTEITTSPNVGEYKYTITVTGQDKNEKQPNNKDSKECTATFTITKKEEVPYTVIFNANGGAWKADGIPEYTIDGQNAVKNNLTVSDRISNVSGYLTETDKFLGWAATSTATQEDAIVAFSVMSPTVAQLKQWTNTDGHTITLYAIWKDVPQSAYTYTIRQHFMKDEKQELGAQNYIELNEVQVGTEISTLIPSDTMVKFDGRMYLYEANNTTVNKQKYEGNETITGETTVIDLYYYLDSWKDGDTQDPARNDEKTSGDGTPDYKQILIQYQVYQEGNGQVSPTFEVVTVKDDKKLTAIHGSSVTKAGTGYTFVTWTGQNATVNETTVDKIVAESTKLNEKNCDPSGDTLQQGNSYTYTAIFLEDKIGGGDNKDQPDGIPDRYQVTINYVSSDTRKGSVGTLTKEVLTIYENGKEGKWASKGKVVASGSTATATGSRCYFVNWTDKDNTQVGTNATLEARTIDVKGGETYTFTANFDRSSGGGSGGSNRPKPPVVEIPDDVPTGLNGKDHYAYVVGYPDGMVYPQKNITRAEVATIFFRLLKDETREANMTKSNSYNDMKDGAWYTCAVSTLSKMGIIKGYEDGSFKPDASISRAEFAAIAARFDPDGDKTPATFSDVSSHWAKDEISIAANHGWIKGYEDGSFKPDQKITRAETMTLVNRVLKRLPETKDDLHKDMKTWPDNQKESAWFYLAVQEATNSHYQKLKKDGTHETWESMRETRDWAALEK